MKIKNIKKDFLKNLKKIKDITGLLKAIYKVKKWSGYISYIQYRKIKNSLGVGIDFLGLIVYTLIRGVKDNEYKNISLYR